MRNELTPAFLEAMSASSREPIQFAHIHLPDRILYVSDREMELFGDQYLGVVEDWGDITTAGTELNDIIAETLQMSLSFWNGGEVPFSYAFLGVDPMDLHVFVYQTFAGLAIEDTATIGEFVIQDPLEIVESTRLFKVDLVSVNMKYTANVGKVLNRVDWPNALEADVNKGIDLIIGDAGAVQTLCAKTPLKATMSGSILKLPTIVNTHENLDEIGFPQSGFIVIDGERMRYNSRDHDTFNVVTRGVLGSVSEHSDGATILEYISDHTYLIGQGPITSISDVRVGGLPADSSKYTTDLDSDPARIIFPVQPFYVDYSRGARSIDVDFDATSPNNGAYQPHYSYDPNSRSYGAIVRRSNTPLAVLQVDPPVDEGEVVRAFLSVEHWATDTYKNDIIRVWVDGLGVVGNLSRPNASDIITVNADVDIDHGHDHSSGGTHGHNFDNPSIGTSNPSHKHNLTAPIQSTIHASNLQTKFTIYDGQYTYDYFDFYSAPSATQNTAIYSIDWYTFSQPTVTTIGFLINGSWKSYTMYAGVNIAIGLPAGQVTRGYFRFYLPSGRDHNTAFNCSCRIEATVNAGVDYFQTAVKASLSDNADVKNQGVDTLGSTIKSADDVKDLIEKNRPVDITNTTSSSKKVVDKYDLTKHLETISWSWLQGREVQLQYTGSANDVSVFITYITFEVEYRQRQNVITNDVTCRPVGSLENRPDAVIQYLLGNVAGVPIEKMGSIFVDVDIWDDLDQWIDTNIWRDSGERLPVAGDPAFLDAAERFAYLGYRLDGVISAVITVQQAIKNICRQARARVIWSGGQVKLAVREKTNSWITVKALGREETQLRSIRIEKAPVTDIENDINLSYQIDRLSQASNEGQYDASVLVSDPASIELHGQKKYNDRWLFDLVRSEPMAVDLADYYIWRYGEPLTLYKFIAYLQQFDLEKEDVLRLTSDFTRIHLLPMRVVENARTFGSGKLGRINTIEFTGESIRHKLWYIIVEDTVLALDEVSVGLQDEETIQDPVALVEHALVDMGLVFDDPISMDERFLLSMGYSVSLTESVLASDSVASSLSIVLADSVNVFDDISVTYEPCFGACGFGGTDPGCTLPFGAPTILSAGVTSTTGLLDTISITTEYYLSFEDSVSVDDDTSVYDAMYDSISFDEELIFNTCFGCTIEGATGFGLSNFGK